MGCHAALVNARRSAKSPASAGLFAFAVRQGSKVLLRWLLGTLKNIAYS